jgi:hypothetical protein
VKYLDIRKSVRVGFDENVKLKKIVRMNEEIFNVSHAIRIAVVKYIRDNEHLVQAYDKKYGRKHIAKGD